MISIPFSGSKRFSYKAVKQIVEAGNYDAVYEPFGGSCVLSVNLFNDGLVNKAVANDYDHFFDLYPEYLDLKDKVVAEGYKQGLRRNVNGKNGEEVINPDGTREKIKSRILPESEKLILQNIINSLVPEKYWRYFSLGNNFTHSGVSVNKDIKISDFCLFSRCLTTDNQRKYLEALDQIRLEHLDWKEFLKRYEKQLTPPCRSILLLDPPYIDTNQEQYQGQFTEDETKLLIRTVIDLGCDFIFFNQDVEKVKKWLKGIDYSLQEIGMGSITSNHKRKDVMAYIKR